MTNGEATSVVVQIPIPVGPIIVGAVVLVFVFALIMFFSAKE